MTTLVWRGVSAIRGRPAAVKALGAAAVVAGSALTAVLVSRGYWYLVVAMVLAVPVTLVLHRNPLLAVTGWLVIDPFLQAVMADGTGRKLYWLVHRALPVLILGLVVVARLAGLNRRRFTFGWLELIMAGYLLASLLSIEYASPDVLANSYLLYDRVAIPMAVYLLVRWYPPGRRSLEAAVPAFGFLLATQLAIGVLQWIAPDVIPRDWLDRAGSRTTGSLDHPNVYGTTVLAAGAFLFHMGHSVRRPRFPRWLYSFALGASLIAAFLTLSRAAWLAALLVALVTFVLHPGAFRRMALAFVGVAVLIVLLAPVEPLLATASSRLFSEQSKESALSRLPVVIASLRMFEARPVTGWGYGNFDLYDREFQGRVGGLFVPDKDHASHNLYLTIMAEQGLVGIVLYMAPVLILLVRTPGAFRRLPRDGPTGRGLLAVAWLVPATHFVVNNFSNMKVPFGLGMYWLSLAVIAGLVLPRRTHTEGDRQVVRLLHPSWESE